MAPEDLSDSMAESAETQGALGSLNAREQRLLSSWQRSLPRCALYSTQDSSQSVQNKLGTDGELPQAVPKEHNRCVSLVNKLFESSPIIRFMDHELRKIGCPPPVFCTPCSALVRGGFSPDHGIAICENHIPTKRRAESTLAHEMVHAYDHCRFKFDMENLNHVACSEVIRPTNRSHRFVP
jgi:mitochondrial inner membrane protease ATP23